MPGTHIHVPDPDAGVHGARCNASVVIRDSDHGVLMSSADDGDTVAPEVDPGEQGRRGKEV